MDIKMEVLTAFTILIFSQTVLSEEDSLLLSCNSDDIECLSKSTATFLERTHKGIANYNIKPIDPLIIPSEVIYNDGAGLTYRCSKVNVTGLRNQDISDFKMDTDAKSVVLTTKAGLNINADVVFEYTKKSKSFAGSFTSYASVLSTATYNYELKDDEKGVKHFEVGPETITCKVVTTPEIHLNPELQQALNNDEDVKSISQDKREELRSRVFCTIVEEAYKDVIHNIRAAAKLLPASSFFKNI